MDRWRDRQTDAGQSDPYVLVCFAGDIKIKVKVKVDNKQDNRNVPHIILSMSINFSLEIVQNHQVRYRSHTSLELKLSLHLFLYIHEHHVIEIYIYNIFKMYIS